MCVKLENFHVLLEIRVSFAERTTTMIILDPGFAWNPKHWRLLPPERLQPNHRLRTGQWSHPTSALSRLRTAVEQVAEAVKSFDDFHEIQNY